jgi:hypothetical protein
MSILAVLSRPLRKSGRSRLLRSHLRLLNLPIFELFGFLLRRGIAIDFRLRLLILSVRFRTLVLLLFGWSIGFILIGMSRLFALGATLKLFRAFRRRWWRREGG